MTASELRIGNLVLDPFFKRVCVTPKMIVEQYQSEIADADYLEPIPLTEEWLTKLGFHKTLENWYGNKGVHVHGNSFWLFKVRYNDSWRVSIVEQTISYVTYVHELQNLYFALTGKELEIKETVL